MNLEGGRWSHLSRYRVLFDYRRMENAVDLPFRQTREPSGGTSKYLILYRNDEEHRS